MSFSIFLCCVFFSLLSFVSRCSSLSLCWRRCRASFGFLMNNVFALGNFLYLIFGVYVFAAPHSAPLLARNYTRCVKNNRIRNLIISKRHGVAPRASCAIFIRKSIGIQLLLYLFLWNLSRLSQGNTAEQSESSSAAAPAPPSSIPRQLVCERSERLQHRQVC